VINDKYKNGLFTIILLLINSLIFLFLSFIYGDAGVWRFATNFGLTLPGILQDGEYYRFVTSTFVHFHIAHLANNMLLLGVLGYNLEHEKGHLKFLVIYFVSGLGGNLLSFAMRYYLGQQHIVSGGASGAVFGLMGAVLAIYIKTKRPIGRLAGRGILVMIGISLYLGFTDTGIDNAAHIGGLIFGFLIALFL
jgi:rhomboid protease GluP